MWNIDYFHGSNKIVKGVVNGWTISPVVYLMSGTPFTVNAGSNMNLDSQGSSRPNVNLGGPSPKLDPHRCRVCGATGQSQQSVATQWFNGTNYLTNPTGASYMANGPGVVGGIGPGGADGNGFTAFDCDVSASIHEGKNFVVIAVDNTRLADGVPTLNTDWWNYGGLTRDVSLIDVPAKYIDDYDLHLNHDRTAIEGTVHVENAEPGEEP